MKLRYVAILLSLSSSIAFGDTGSTFLTPYRVQDVDMDANQLGGVWFAVHSKGGKWYLSRTGVRAVNDNAGSYEIRSKYPSAIGFLKGRHLTEGPLESASLVRDSNGNSSSFRFRQHEYRLAVRAVPFKYYSAELNKVFDNIRNDVYFSDGRHRTLVYGNSETGESCSSPFVEWAGDIDRDGKPDLIAHFSDDSEKNGSSCVFLSSGAKKGRMLKNAGCQFFSG